MKTHYTRNELINMGIGSIGENTFISKAISIFNISNLHIGNSVRIDNYTILAISGSAKLIVGNHVHISAYNYFNGLGNIILEDFVTTAPFVRFFSSTDDYSGNSLTGATVPKEYLGTKTDNILVKRHSIIGTGSSIMPGVILAEGTAVGAYSLVKVSTEDFAIVAGVPAKFIKTRSRDLVEIEKRYIDGK